MLGVYPSQGKAEHDIDDQVCTGRESKDVVDDIINHRGARVVFLTMRLIDTWKAPSVDVDYDTFVERFQENVID